MTPRHAYEIMLKDKGSYSPAAMAALVKAVGLYPPGQKVVLSDGTTGVVMAAGEDIERPRVKVTHDRDGGLLGEGRMRAVDLAEDDAPAVAKLLIGA